MDARKIQFLIEMQREIDSLEAKDGNTPKVEKVKSRFYDVVEVKEMASAGDKVVAEEGDKDVIIEQPEPPGEKPLKKDRTTFCPHHPRFVTEFLKNFRRVNDTGLRELVHPPYDEQDFNLQETFEKIENELFPDKPNYNKFSKSDRIPYFLWVHIRKDLMDVYKMYGLPHWEAYRKHPLFSEPILTKKIHNFIKSIRFGRDAAIETSFREHLIPSCLQQLKSQNEDTWLTEEVVEYRAIEKFDGNIVLMTDVIRVEFAIGTILRLISQKSNWNGEPINAENVSFKRVIITSQYTRNEQKELITTLTIVDQGSWCNKQPDYLFASGDMQAIAQNLWSLCEWEVLARFVDNETYCLDMLKSLHKDEKVITKTNEHVEGFTHRLTFYH